MDKGSVELLKLLDKVKKMTHDEFMEFYLSGWDSINYTPNVKAILKNDNIDLYILFTNNVIKKINIKQMIKDYPELKDIDDYSLFHVATIYYDEYGIGWDGEYDIHKQYLWRNGTLITNNDFLN